MDGLTIQEAARRLGLSEDGVRKRLKRGRLQGYQTAGRWYVVLDESETQPQTPPRGAEDGAQTELVAELRARIAYLETALAREQATVQAIAMRALPSPAETTPPRRPWWQRVFG